MPSPLRRALAAKTRARRHLADADAGPARQAAQASLHRAEAAVSLLQRREREAAAEAQRRAARGVDRFFVLGRGG